MVGSISESMDGIAFSEHLKRLVTGTAIHAKRRAAELNGSFQMLDECGIVDAMTVTSKYKHELMEEYHFNEKYLMSMPSAYDEIIAQMRKKHRSKGKRIFFKWELPDAQVMKSFRSIPASKNV